LRNDNRLGFRFRIMLYTLLSITAAGLIAALVMVCCVRFGLLTSGISNEVAGGAYSAGGAASSAAPVDSIMRQSDYFYRVFGVTVRWQLIVLLLFTSVAVFLITFFSFTRQMNADIVSIVSGIEKISDGDFNTRIETVEKGELCLIATHINEMAESMSDMRAKSQDAEKTKNDLITNVAHDLRTPLTSIIGYLDITLNDPEMEAPKRQKYLKIAQDKAKGLNSLIEDLFSFTKISYSQMPFEMSRIDLVKLLEQEIEELYPVFSDAGLECQFHSDVSSVILEADGQQLVRVFENILGNAVKHGKDGKIIKVDLFADSQWASVSILNYGSIIPAESLPYIFDKFYKVDSSRTGAGSSEGKGGTGLGLAIAKSIVERHGGRISASSSEDGTVFTVMLPVAASVI